MACSRSRLEGSRVEIRGASERPDYRPRDRRMSIQRSLVRVGGGATDFGRNSFRDFSRSQRNVAGSHRLGQRQAGC